MKTCQKTRCTVTASMGFYCVKHWYEDKGLQKPEIPDETRTPFEHGIAMSDLAAEHKWTPREIVSVDTAIDTVARRHDTFTADDVYQELGPNFPVTKGMAGRLLRAVNAGVIENTGATTISKRGGQHCHGQRLTIWRSRVWEVLA